MPDFGIGSKWPAVRAIGPNVTKEQALDFIWRTDSTLQDPYQTGRARDFLGELRDWLGLPDYAGDREMSLKDKIREMERQQDVCRGRGQLVDLQHFKSYWVIALHAFSTTGLVSPDGDVLLATNFGKWPSVSSIESDLNLLTRQFDWLKCQIGLWDDTDINQPPDCAWYVSEGTWQRMSPHDISKDVREASRTRMLQRADLDPLVHSELTWTMEEIKGMWGDRI